MACLFAAFARVACSCSSSMQQPAVALLSLMTAPMAECMSQCAVVNGLASPEWLGMLDVLVR